jgi:beta-mannosidase
MEDGQNYWIEVSAERLAKNIMLDFPTADGQFSDNYFDLLPGETRRITFKPGKSVFLTNEDLKKVTVMDTY